MVLKKLACINVTISDQFYTYTIHLFSFENSLVFFNSLLVLLNELNSKSGFYEECFLCKNMTKCSSSSPQHEKHVNTCGNGDAIIIISIYQHNRHLKKI